MGFFFFFLPRWDWGEVGVIIWGQGGEVGSP